MKKLLLGISMLLFSLLTMSQENPVHWNYSIKKVNKNLFEIHLIANIEDGWHIYAQKQPEDAIALPTTIKFDEKNPFIKFDKTIKEVGEKKFFKDETVGIAAYQYKDKVDFVTFVTVGKVKTQINGTIAFQSCTDEKCLPPASVSFVLDVDNTK